MVAIGFPKVETIEEFNENLKRGPNGLELKYYRLKSPDDDPFNVILALNLEISRSVKQVSASELMPSTTKVVRIVKSVGFKFDEMVCDQYKSGLTIRELRRLHGIGNKTILEILRNMEVPVPDRNTKRGVTDAEIAQSHEKFGGNYTRMATALGMHRVTVSKKVKTLGLDK